MAKTINTNIDDGFLLFTFTNKQGEVFSSFKLNPTDINIAARAEELETFFEQAQESVKNVSSSKDLFKEPITATTVFGNGQVFAYIVLDKINEALALEIEKRKKKMQEVVNKYTEKYTK